MLISKDFPGLASLNQWAGRPLLIKYIFTFCYYLSFIKLRLGTYQSKMSLQANENELGIGKIS